MPEPGMKQYLIDELNKSIDENTRLNHIITALGSGLLRYREIVSDYHRLVAAGFALSTPQAQDAWRDEIERLQQRARVALKGDTSL